MFCSNSLHSLNQVEYIPLREMHSPARYERRRIFPPPVLGSGKGIAQLPISQQRSFLDQVIVKIVRTEIGIVIAHVIVIVGIGAAEFIVIALFKGEAFVEVALVEIVSI